MPKDPTTAERRALESWRARACAAGLCVGAQVFLFGTGVAMPVSLNSAWIAALITLPFSTFFAVACRRKTIACDGRISRPALILLALALLANAVFAAAALVSFAEQTLLEQSRSLWSAAITVIAIFLCTLSGGSGTAWLCFALRWALPLLIGILVLFSMPMKVPSGLFPLLGPGLTELSVSTLCMLGASSPALMLFLPPPELSDMNEEAFRQSIPKTGFFVRRMLSGAAVGILILFCACVCTTYEAIGESVEWGARLRIVASDQPHEGIPQTILSLLQMTTIILLGVNVLSSADQALCLAMKKTRPSRTVSFALSLLLFVLLLLLIACGFEIALFTAPLLLIPSLLVLLLCRRRKKAS